jgi:hypothetical protein
MERADRLRESRLPRLKSIGATAYFDHMFGFIRVAAPHREMGFLRKFATR